MVRRVPFTKYEAVLLLNAYLMTIDGSQSRAKAVEVCSEQLRQIAINSGLQIDNTYRNKNGIFFQMESMESAFKGKTIVKPATKLFSEIVSLYRTDRQNYEEILKKAKTMANAEKDYESLFMAWLSEKVSSAQLSELYMALHEIENQAIKSKIVNKSIYEDINITLVKKIKTDINQSRIFKFKHKRQMGQITRALSYLLQYASETEENTFNENASPGEAEVVKSLNTSVADLKKENQNEQQDKIIEKPIQKMEIDFSSIGDISFTKPYELIYFGDTYSVKSWKDAYIKACACLFDDYPKSFEKFRADSLSKYDMGWIVNAENIHRLTAAEKIADDYFIETKRSACDLMTKLKWIMDECLVDYENLSILFSGEVKNDSKNSVVTDSAKAKLYYERDDQMFYNWMKTEQKMADGTCRSYVSAIRALERFAISHGLTNNKILYVDVASVKETVKELFENQEFLDINAQQHNRFRATLSKYMQYLGEEWRPNTNNAAFEIRNTTTKKTDSVDATPYIKLMVKYFPRGYRLGSALDRKRFFRYYETDTGSPLELKPEQVECILNEAGIQHDGKVYMAESMLSEDMKEKLLSYIQALFEEGRDTIYYEALFQKFSEELLDYTIYNADMMRAYLSRISKGQFLIGRSYISKTARKSANSIDEVRTCLREYGSPMQIDELCKILKHIPADKIYSLLSSNSEFVRNSKGEYFHADSLDLTENELEDIAVLIDDILGQQEFISGNEFIDVIHRRYPNIYEKNSEFSMIGWRDALKYKLNDRYSFAGNIISRSDSKLTTSDVFENFAANRKSFSLDELTQFAENIGVSAASYLESVYKKVIRVHQNLFVAKDLIGFRIAETDSVLDRFCTNRYLPLADIREFGFFPDASYPWTEYLLEQYVAFFSEKYCLLHSNYNLYCTVGAIVKRDCGYETFDNLITDVLADSGMQLSKDSALDYLVNNGYLARRSYAEIEKLLIDAASIRNKKGNK